jgi:replication-associated recombination protein RarA
VLSDPWARVETAHGFRADELVSSLQKSIRRGLVENAVLVAYELYVTSAELEDFLWRRLSVIAVEDVGGGRADAPLLVDALDRMRQREPRGNAERYLFALHAVRLLATSPKDRTSDEMATWAARLVESGERLPEVPDVALDMHTERGRELGRGLPHFLEEGALVAEEVGSRDTTYRDWLLERVAREEE